MSSPLWTASQLADALKAPIPADAQSVEGLQIDSRRVKPGDLFFALPGDPGNRFTVTSRSDRDGHDFVAAALAAGAAGAVVHRLPAAVDDDRLWQVDDTLDALWQLAGARRRALTGPVVAVTGSSGKTTAKTFFAAATDWSSSAGSFNNHLGVPLSMAMTPAATTGAVYEIGMNHPGEIAPLSRLAQPDLALVLNVQDAHAEAFDDPDGIRKEKLSICAGLGPDGVLVVHDAVALDGVPSGLEVQRFGTDARSLVVLEGVEGGIGRFRIDGRAITARVPGGGQHRAMTLAAVLAVLTRLQWPLDRALELPETLVPDGRGNRLAVAGVTLIDDSYNANPASMGAALKSLIEEKGADRAQGAGRCFALLGEMGELGDLAPSAHEDLAEPLAALDGAWLVGDRFENLAKAASGTSFLRHWQGSSEGLEPLIEDLVSTLEKNDKLLIKGSNTVFWARQFVNRLKTALESGRACERRASS